MPRPSRLYSLNKPKLRQSWNKYNFYNIAKGAGVERPIQGTPTFFQQKWKAKTKTRAYHGEHVPEKKWTRLFSPRLQAAVDMPAQYLAAHNGSEQAEGTGSGLEHETITAASYSRVARLDERKRRVATMPPPRFGDVNARLSEPYARMTPHVQMVFAPLERRLDTAVFRALFASSVRQSRQFIIHGAVKVNGKKMLHPSYLLNPGDMFQVETEKVLFATGKTKTGASGRWLQRGIEFHQKRMEKLSAASPEGDKGDEAAAAPSEGAETAAEGEQADSDVMSPEEAWNYQNESLKKLFIRVKSVLSEEKKHLSAVDKLVLRQFRKFAKIYLSRPEDKQEEIAELMEGLKLHLESHDKMRAKFAKYQITEDDDVQAEASEAAEKEAKSRGASENPKVVAKVFGELSEAQQKKAQKIISETTLSVDEMRNLSRLLKQEEENPFDESKPYATPWEPRPFMSAFAFIPRYLEVNPKICAAVYLRHPVARRGMAEVPTPFAYLTNQLTHNYYLERGARRRVL